MISWENIDKKINDYLFLIRAFNFWVLNVDLLLESRKYAGLRLIIVNYSPCFYRCLYSHSFLTCSFRFFVISANFEFLLRIGAQITLFFRKLTK